MGSNGKTQNFGLWFSGLLVIAAFLLPAARGTGDGEPFLFGTLIRITAYGPGASNAVERAFGELERIMTDFRNPRHCPNQCRRVKARSGWTRNFPVLQTVFQLAAASDGYFNPAIGPWLSFGILATTARDGFPYGNYGGFTSDPK